MVAPTSPRAGTRNRRRPHGRPGHRFTGAQLTVLVGGFLVNVGSFALYPYLAVLLRDRMGVGMEQVGLILGLGTMVQYGSATVTAALAERLGLRRSLIGALLLYSLGGTAFLAGGHRVGFTVAGILLISAAGSLYSPAYRSYLLCGADAGQRPRLVSAGNAAGSLGIAVGPVVGALFVHNSGGTFAVVTALYLVVAVSHLFLRREPVGEQTPAVEPFRRMLHGMAVLPFALTALTFYLNMHFYQYLAVYAEGRMAAAFYGAVMMGYALIQVAVQPLLANRVGRARYPVVLAVGFAGYTVGMVALADGHPVTIAAGVAVISLSSALLFLRNDLAALAESKRSATVTFGQQRLAIGVGASLSGLVGGAVYGRFEEANRPSGFWLVVAVQCVLLPLLLLGAARWRRRATATGPSPASGRP
ncbi:MFS transporter [Micromonospora yangpuensis]|uniref:Major Facilitator Superfamily protein n=1 Tax=Micromonospora yangpuensis TaxID=683228 RepID=A0A1C6UKL8_9ACTN|nr:MFS transporter [Micromonospora yangpuensis]GGM17185.1 MFS transporter [Micromonospora yangpuensis]SCL54587.1 Major Facilitator Superfamily protein [Micromonospora yangpuensis]